MDEGQRKLNPGPCYVPDWAERLEKRESILPPISALPGFSVDTAEKSLRTFDQLVLPFAGGRKAGEAVAPWVREFVYYWMGAEDPVSRARFVDECVVLMGKKSTKTSSMALVLLLQFLMTTNRQAEAIIIAPTQEIAGMAFANIKGVIQASGLEQRYRPYRGMKIEDKRADWHTKLQVKTSEVNVLGGTTADYILLDEMHILSKAPSAPELMEHMRGARAGKDWGSAIICTTHAFEPPKGPWKGLYESYRDTHEGYNDVPQLMLRYEFPRAYQSDEDKWRDSRLWHMVNPSLDYVGTRERMAVDMQRAEQEGSLPGFKNQRLNIPAGARGGDSQWLGVDHWDKCFDPTLSGPGLTGLDELLRRSSIVTIGMDGGGFSDLQSVAVMGREKGTAKWLVWTHSWVDLKVLDMRPLLGVKLKHFADLEELTILDFQKKSEDGTHNVALRELAKLMSYINKTRKLGRHQSVGIDELQRASLKHALQDRNLVAPIMDAQIHPVAQGRNLHPYFAGLGEKCILGDFAHGGNSLLNWAIGNVQMEMKGSHLVAQKQNLHPDHKIDPFMAMVFAGKQMTMAEEGGAYIPRPAPKVVPMKDLRGDPTVGNRFASG